MTQRLPSLAVVIPTVGRAASLRTCLEALAAQSDPDFEVVVVCDGPDAQTRELARAPGISLRVRWLELGTNRGPAHARNVGAAEAASVVAAVTVACGMALPFFKVTAAAKRYPFPTTVSTNCGFSGSSFNATRVFLTAMLIP